MAKLSQRLKSNELALGLHAPHPLLSDKADMIDHIGDWEAYLALDIKEYNGVCIINIAEGDGA